MILERNPIIVDIYRLTVKIGSDNFRQSAIQDVIDHVKRNGVEVIVYESVLEEDEIEGLRVVKDLDKFKQVSDVIVANRMDEEIKDSREKVDLFSRD